MICSGCDPHRTGFSKYELGSHFNGLTIDAAALYVLSAPDVSREVREKAIDRAEAGELFAVIAKAKGAAGAGRNCHNDMTLCTGCGEGECVEVLSTSVNVAGRALTWPGL